MRGASARRRRGEDGGGSEPEGAPGAEGDAACGARSAAGGGAAVAAVRWLARRARRLARQQRWAALAVLLALAALSAVATALALRWALTLFGRAVASVLRPPGPRAAWPSRGEALHDAERERRLHELLRGGGPSGSAGPGPVSAAPAWSALSPGRLGARASPGPAGLGTEGTPGVAAPAPEQAEQADADADGEGGGEDDGDGDGDGDGEAGRAGAGRAGGGGQDNARSPIASRRRRRRRGGPQLEQQAAGAADFNAGAWAGAGGAGGDTWQWLRADIRALMDEDASPAPRGPAKQPGAAEGLAPEAPDASSSSRRDDVTGLLRQLLGRVNWSATEGRGRGRPKQAVVLGTASIIKRDFEAVSRAYSAVGLVVEQASDLSPAVARGLRDGNLGAVRSREWGVILCLSLSTDKCLSGRDFARIEEQGGFSRVNRVAALQQVLWSKDQYCATSQLSGPWLPAFTFPCWVLPRDAGALRARLGALGAAAAGPAAAAAEAAAAATAAGAAAAAAAAAPATTGDGDTTRWIVKPYKQGGGKGIFVLDSAAEVAELARGASKVVVQPYLTNPHLLDRRKWDLRTYVLLTSAAPVARAYVFREGLVRLATEEYSAGARHGGNKTQFLTNTSINKKKVADMSKLTWSFAKLEQRLGAAAFRTLFSRIRRAVGMMLVTAERAFTREFDRVAPNFRCSSCFHLLGVDVIVDANLVPRVIEVNGEPSMQLTGAAQSHYDATKSAMQKEVALIVLQSQPRLAGMLADSLRQAGVSLARPEYAWLQADESALLYLMQARREWAVLKGFAPVYPDPELCDSAPRRKLWVSFLWQLYGARDSQQPGVEAEPESGGGGDGEFGDGGGDDDDDVDNAAARGASAVAAAIPRPAESEANAEMAARSRLRLHGVLEKLACAMPSA